MNRLSKLLSKEKKRTKKHKVNTRKVKKRKLQTCIQKETKTNHPAPEHENNLSAQQKSEEQWHSEEYNEIKIPCTKQKMNTAFATILVLPVKRGNVIAEVVE